MAPTLSKLPIDVFDVESGAGRYRTIEQLIAEAGTSGRESWAEFCGTMLKAKPGDSIDVVDERWLFDRAG